MSAGKLTPQRWVYAGQRAGVKSKLVDVFLPESDTNVTRCYKADRFARTVGGVYLVEAADDGSKAVIGTARYVGMHADKKQVLQWKAEHDVTLVAATAESAEKRAKTNQDALVALEPLRALWLKSVGRNRLALEVVVLKYLRSGNTP